MATPIKYDSSIHDAPYSNRTSISYWDVLLMTLMIPVLPIKFLLSMVIIMIGKLLAHIAIYGLNEEELSEKSLSGYRLSLQHVIYFLIRCLNFTLGVVYIREDQKYHKDQYKNDSPLIVVAPHTSYMDGPVIIGLSKGAPVARIESKSNWFVGRTLMCLQTIWADRHSTQGKGQTVKQLNKRVDNLHMPRITIFPEGTTSNGSVLYQFKTGAFRNGHSVQPVTITYSSPLNYEAVRDFTWESPPPWLVIICMLLTPYLIANVTWFPPYQPNAEEKENATLYARNVDKFFSSQLSIPYSEVTFQSAKEYMKQKEKKKN